MIRIECTEYEQDIILKAFNGWCPFEDGTIEDCNEDSRCDECLAENIEFVVGDEIKENDNE